MLASLANLLLISLTSFGAIVRHKISVSYTLSIAEPQLQEAWRCETLWGDQYLLNVSITMELVF
jgi:hypothetical protein